MAHQVWTELRLDGAAPVSVSLVPHLSILSMLTDAVGGRRRGLPAHLRRHVQCAVSLETLDVVRPLTAPGYSVAPDSVVPLPPTRDSTLEEQVHWLRDASPDELAEDLEQAFGGEQPPAHWWPYLRRPKRWLRGYATALSEVWQVAAPLWRRAHASLDREIARVGAAAVRGGLPALLGSLSPKVWLDGDVLRIADQQAGQFELGGRRIVLVPMLAGRDAFICSLDQPDHVWLAYPLAGGHGLWSPRAGGEDDLEMVLGSMRATILRLLDRPMSMGQLAGRLHTVPSAVTYQCDRLVAGDLVVRERHGREVRVRRTARGDALLSLFD
ncbi:hypothetical protein [Thermoactinospora rubra]|uniref:hypothetical protein n=1 Tax=Thermoactinospora rubra TaxID=1088767 RepID=UPI000A116016|nr:hypothetical protein [Thermoactinospora rubra]